MPGNTCFRLATEETIEMMSIAIICVGLAVVGVTWAITAQERREQRRQKR